MNDVSRTHRPNNTTSRHLGAGRMFWPASNGTYRKQGRKLTKVERRQQRRTWARQQKRAA